MSVRSWISDELHELLGFTAPAVIDYVIAQAQQPPASVQSLTAFILDSTTPDKQQRAEAFAQQLLQRLPRATAPSSAAADAQRHRDEERRKLELVRKNDRYAMVDDTAAEEEEHRRMLKAAREREKSSKDADRVKRRDRKSRASDSEDDDDHRRRKLDPTHSTGREDQERKEGEDTGASEGDAAVLERMTEAESREYDKKRDIAERDAFIARLAARELSKTKRLGPSSASPSASQHPAADKAVADMTREEMQTMLPLLRQKAREAYLTRREQQQLELLRLQLEDERTLWKEEELTLKERRELERKRRLLELAQQRKGLSAEVQAYHMPEGYVKDDGTLDSKKRKALLEARYVEEKGRAESEQDGWEREQKRKSDISVGSKDRKSAADDYQYVFDDSIEFIKAELMAGSSTVKAEDAAVKQEAQRPLSAYELIQVSRRKLPIYPYRDELLAAIAHYQTLIVVGETGSGKTTQIIQYLHEAGYTADGKQIGCTQPRRVAAMSVAARVATEMNVKLGHEVGYSIRFEDCTSERTLIKYLTDGMLLREFLTAPDLAAYSVIMVDEAHERTLSTDILFGLIKDIARYRSDLKVLISSATLDAEKFSTYFDNAPIFIIPGRRYPVDIYYTKAPEADYLDAAVVTVLQIHTTQPRGDVLVFLTGQEEIESMQETLAARAKSLPKNSPELLVLPIYAALPSEQQARIFAPTPANARKVVLATNIAETSLTIDGIVYVIDPGFSKLNAYNPRTGMDSLIVAPISRASANQRAGRAGRVAAGKCFRLYTAHAYSSELEETTVPEIQRTNLAHVVLMLKSLGIDDILHFDYIDPPPSETLIQAFTQLYALGALNDSGELTRLGRRMAELPMDPQLAKMLLGSEAYGCSSEVLSICAMVGVGAAVMYRPKEKAVHADTAHRLLSHPSGDHLTLLNIWRQWEESGFSSDWCYDHFIQLRAMKRARDIREQLLQLAERVELTVTSRAADDDTSVLKAITSGYFYQIARLDRSGDYRTMKHKLTVYIHPSSVLGRKGERADAEAAKTGGADGAEGGAGVSGLQPSCVLYHELVLTKKEYMRCVSAVEIEWLSEIAPHLYSLKDLTADSANRKTRRRGRGQHKP